MQDPTLDTLITDAPRASVPAHLGDCLLGAIELTTILGIWIMSKVANTTELRKRHRFDQFNIDTK